MYLWCRFGDFPLKFDFNYVRYPHNRNIKGANRNDMFAFNEAISSLAIAEISSKGRKKILGLTSKLLLCWKNLTEFSLLKLGLLTTPTLWGILISDQIPCKIQIGSSIPRSTIFGFEIFCFNATDLKKQQIIFGNMTSRRG